MTVADDVHAVADALFAAIEAGDIDAVEALYDPAIEVWNNTDGVAQDRAANLRTLGWVIDNLADRSYDDVRRQVTPDGFVQQHVLRVTTASGRRAEVPACLVAGVAGGRITRIDEYLDSAHVAALLT